MNHAKRLSSSDSHATPLVNLFAYIRDLFTTTRPVSRYDEGADSLSWPIAQFHHLASALTDTDLIHCQWDDPTRPLLSLSRGENVSPIDIPAPLSQWVSLDTTGHLPRLTHIAHQQTDFTESAARMQAYGPFFKQANGQALDAVADLKIPSVLDKWIQLDMEGDKLKISRIERAEERFEDDELRVELYRSLQRNFQAYQEDTHHQTQVNSAFDQLHDLFYTLKAQPDRQICLSFGLVSGTIGGEIYRNFLFHIPLKASLKQQQLILEADTLAHVITCEQSFTELLEAHFTGESEEKIRERKLTVLREVDQFNTQSREFSFEPDYLRGTFYQTAIRILEIFPAVRDQFFTSTGLNFEVPPVGTDEAISLSFSPVIHVKPLASGAHIAKDAENIISKINALGTQGFNGEIPDFFKKLFSLRKPGNPLRIAYRTEDKGISSPSLSEAVPERFLFPLPYNTEQLSIAEALLRQDAVTVQGPPGTGKSHTIANLASHFVAAGKSILIVSKNAKALEVIKEKLPKGIRDLAVALLEGNQNQEELKHAIDAVKHHLSGQYDEASIGRMEEELATLDNQAVALRQQVSQQISANQRSLTLTDPDTQHPITRTAAVWVDQIVAQELIHDPISYEQDTSGLAAQLAQYARLIESVDLSLAGLELPEPAQLNALDQGRLILEQLEQAAIQMDFYPFQQVDIDSISPELLSQVQELLDQCASLAPYERLLQHPRFDARELAAVWEQTLPLCKQVEAGQDELLSVQVTLGESTGDPDELLEALQALMAKYNAAGKLPLLKQKMLPAHQKRFFSMQVNGRTVQRLAHLVWIEKYLQQAATRKAMGIVMDNYLSRIGIPGKGEDVLQIYHEWAQVSESLARIDVLNATMRQHQLPVLDFSVRNRKEAEAFLTDLPAYCRHAALQREWDALIEPFQAFSAAHEPIRELIQAWESKDLYAIDRIRETIAARRIEIKQAEELAALQEGLQNVLPQTLQQLFHQQAGAYTESAIESAIFQQKISAFLAETLEELGDPNGILTALQQLKQQQESLICELISHKTWHHKQATVTDQQRAALAAWRNDLINIGKGHGKNTERNMQSAVGNMQLAREVVPIWIMQQHTAISFFPDPQPGQFDLLIVDEASQCDISMLNLIFRCKKVIVVGDENQTSVATQARLFPIARTNQLLDRYMVNHPFKQQFNINNRSTSIYTLSGVIYPNIISLREHFRCRPELIGFSNRYVYDSHIVPLKTATDNRYGAPTEVHYIEDEPDNPKKPAIAKAVVQLISGLVEDVQAGHLPELPTVGILCLESSNEAHRELLIRELGRNPLIKAHADDLKLLVGTSREFQGDERDVMLLTVTGSHKFTETGKIRPPRAVLGEEMMRIYNVATSRARDKAIVLHSIHPEALARMNPECFRKRLIDYFERNSRPASEHLEAARQLPMHPKTGELGNAIYQAVLKAQPTQAIFPQYRIGPYEVDLAILQEGKKVALFIDGAGEEADAQRSVTHQLVLERAGWQCLRIQALDWAMNREATEAHLLEMCAARSH